MNTRGRRWLLCAARNEYKNNKNPIGRQFEAFLMHTIERAATTYPRLLTTLYCIFKMQMEGWIVMTGFVRTATERERERVGERERAKQIQAYVLEREWVCVCEALERGDARKGKQQPTFVLYMCLHVTIVRSHSHTRLLCTLRVVDDNRAFSNNSLLIQTKLFNRLL